MIFSRNRIFFLRFLLLFFLIFPMQGTISEEPNEQFWNQEGEVLLENKKYSEAKELAESVLSQNPTETKAEFLLTRAWIGLGKTELQKGNRRTAREYLEKAYRNWPLNEELRKDLASLQTLPKSQGNQESGRDTPTNAKELKESLDSLRDEIHRWRTEIRDERKDSDPSELRKPIVYLLLAQLILQAFGFYWIRRK